MINLVVLSKDKPEYLERLHASLEAQIEHEVILIDNGIDEQTPQLAEQYGWRRISNGRNMSFSEGVNYGMYEATSDKVILLNNDVILDPFTIDKMVEFGGNLQGALLRTQNGLVNHAGVKFDLNGRSYHVGRDEPVEKFMLSSAGYAYVPAITFALVLVDKKFFFEAGGLDEGYVYGYEDTDFCGEAVEAGVMPVVNYRATAIHEEFGTRERGGDVKNFYYFFGKWILTGRYRNALQKLEGN